MADTDGVNTGGGGLTVVTIPLHIVAHISVWFLQRGSEGGSKGESERDMFVCESPPERDAIVSMHITLLRLVFTILTYP